MYNYLIRKNLKILNPVTSNTNIRLFSLQNHMIETILAIWIDTIYECSKEFAQYHISWHSKHDYIQRYINPNKIDECYIFIMILIVYRFWLLSNFFYFNDNGFILLSLINIVVIFVGIVWIYYFYIMKKNIDLMGYVLVFNFLDLVNNIYVVSDSNCRFIFYYSIAYVLFCLLTLVVLAIWNNRLAIRKILVPKKKLQYQMFSHLIKSAKNSECVCCHQDYDEDNPFYYLLECGHHAHAQCFRAWWNVSEEKKCLYAFCKV